MFSSQFPYEIKLFKNIRLSPVSMTIVNRNAKNRAASFTEHTFIVTLANPQTEWLSLVGGINASSK